MRPEYRIPFLILLIELFFFGIMLKKLIRPKDVTQTTANAHTNAPSPLATKPTKKIDVTPTPTLIPFVQESGTELIYKGKPFRFLGVNRYNLSTTYNSPCGSTFSDADL